MISASIRRKKALRDIKNVISSRKHAVTQELRKIAVYDLTTPEGMAILSILLELQSDLEYIQGVMIDQKVW